MKNYDSNIEINSKLLKLYDENTRAFLELWNNCFPKSNNPPTRINDFGIIDTEHFDKEKRVLFIAKETRGWNFSFLSWINTMASTRSSGTQYPRMWYNIGRWAKLICNSTCNIENLLSEKEESLSGLSYIAFTNLNKIGGFNISKKSYRDLIKNKLPFEILSKEIYIIKPNTIVLCGIKKRHVAFIDETIRVVEMPHPSARNISNRNMLQQLKAQIQ